MSINTNSFNQGMDAAALASDRLASGMDQGHSAALQMGQEALPGKPGDTSSNVAFQAMRGAQMGAASDRGAAEILHSGFSIEDKAGGMGAMADAHIGAGAPGEGHPLAKQGLREPVALAEGPGATAVAGGIGARAIAEGRDSTAVAEGRGAVARAEGVGTEAVAIGKDAHATAEAPHGGDRDKVLHSLPAGEHAHSSHPDSEHIGLKEPGRVGQPVGEGIAVGGTDAGKAVSIPAAGEPGRSTPAVEGIPAKGQ